MPRKGAVPAREILPDTKYGDVIVHKLINKVMKDGKKSVAEWIVYTALESAAKEVNMEPVELLHKVVEKLKPEFEVRPRRVGGATYQVPVEGGQVLAKPGTVKPHKKFRAQVYVLSKEEGGRHTPFFVNYRPQFYFRTADVTGTVVKLPEGQEMVMPGDNVEIEVELVKPVAMEEGLRFAIREGGRTVGAGVVTKIIE